MKGNTALISNQATYFYAAQHIQYVQGLVTIRTTGNTLE